MDVMVLDKSFTPIAIFDQYDSFIWTEKYSEAGDFELHVPMSKPLIDIFKMDYYLQTPKSERLMVIETLKVDTDLEDGNFLTVSGRSAEILLNRRQIWGQHVISGNLQDSVLNLIDINFTNAYDPARVVSFLKAMPTDDPVITALTAEAQYSGEENLYDVIQGLCSENKIGFKLVLTPDNELMFSLYNGVNRSYDQNDNEYVLFSPAFDNLIRSQYLETIADYKNTALVGGEGDGNERVYTSIGVGVNGLDRKEMFVDASDISRKTDDGDIPMDTYVEQLKTKGREELHTEGHLKTKTIEGDVDNLHMYEYQKSYNVGDIVELENEYGQSATVRVTAVTYSRNEEGESLYPTFESIEDELEDTI